MFHSTTYSKGNPVATEKTHLTSSKNTDDKSEGWGGNQQFFSCIYSNKNNTFWRFSTPRVKQNRKISEAHKQQTLASLQRGF